MNRGETEQEKNKWARSVPRFMV